uniref:Uncharacterized protein n=2 Tax=Serratia marcescens TaxID=615 RepID=A0A345IR33_SERMA|nr:hypothetical protein [Serratia marcescens]AXH02305.1 hypothetical protein [Serratia marcescens]DAC77010.1 TPA_exp: hypothetical protein [Serratia marcescens BIDMC 44]DAC77229.1 TPA_exp: hypothetical protein [Serratia marcescens]
MLFTELEKLELSNDLLAFLVYNINCQDPAQSLENIFY